MNKPYIEDLIDYNRYSRPKYKLIGVCGLVVHWTANANSSANAEMHQRYFNNLSGRYGSAHIFVDRNEARLIIPLDEVAYHANDRNGTKIKALEGSITLPSGRRYVGGANVTAIGVEMCVESDGTIHPETIKRTEKVVRYLLDKFDLSANDVYRHYDVTGKYCPKPWVDDPSEFTAFKKRLAGNSATVAPVTPISEKGEYTGNSVVDYLHYNGEDASFKARKELADKYGIKGYEGSGAQNLELLDRLRSGERETVKAEYEGNSIVDYLEHIDRDSSYENRKRLAEEYGVENYTGTAKDNTTLLKVMRDGKKPTVSKVNKGKKYPLPTSGDYSRKSHGGRYSKDVENIQRALCAVYFYPEKGAKNNGVDGYFGAKTEDAVRRFQSIYTPNDVDGHVGPKTLAQLNKQANG